MAVIENAVREYRQQSTINKYLIQGTLSGMQVLFILYSESEYEFEEIEGNGYCSDASGNHDVAKIHYKKMSHEEARGICRADNGCVAYAFSLSRLSLPNSIDVIIYSDTLCTDWCTVTDWQANSDLITQTADNGSWNDGKCYVKRSYDHYFNKCISNPQV